MPNLIVSVSGVRGVYRDGLDETCAERFAFAFGKLKGGTIVVGRDSRRSGESLARAVITGLQKSGANVIYLGLASTPTIGIAVPSKSASGGVIITASHNPAQWNGIKFLGNDGVLLNALEGAKVLAEYQSVGDIHENALIGSIREWDRAAEYHIHSLLNLDILDGERISSRHYTVCLDTVNGAGGPICTKLLNQLGCTVHTINEEPTGDFPHNPEPVPDHIQDLCSEVKRVSADIGFAVDPDGDRLSLVSDEGIAIGEEYTLALAVDSILGSMKTPVVCNLSTSQMVDDIAGRHGSKVYRSAVGEVNVVEMMREAGAMIGGEGNGGVIYPPLHYGRDAVLGIALILHMMVDHNEKLSDIIRTFPHYSMIKDKVEITHSRSWKEKIKKMFSGSLCDERDGIKCQFPDSWVHIRESNTEPIVRIIAEAPTKESALELIRKSRAVIIEH